jgi:hypothetical protein
MWQHILGTQGYDKIDVSYIIYKWAHLSCSFL